MAQALSTRWATGRQVWTTTGGNIWSKDTRLSWGTRPLSSRTKSKSKAATATAGAPNPRLWADTREKMVSGRECVCVCVGRVGGGGLQRQFYMFRLTDVNASMQQTSCVPTQPSFGIVCGKMCQVKFFFLPSPCVCSSDSASPQEIKREKKSAQIQQVANKLCRAAECQIFSSVPDAVGDLIDGDTICALRPPLGGGCSSGFVFVPSRSFPANSAVACRAERFLRAVFIFVTCIRFCC